MGKCGVGCYRVVLEQVHITGPRAKCKLLCMYLKLCIFLSYMHVSYSIVIVMYNDVVIVLFMNELI